MKSINETMAMFLSCEQEDDWIVAFFVAADEDYNDGYSIILMRDKKFEYIIPEHEKGVTLSDESLPEATVDERIYLESVKLKGTVIEIISDTYHHRIDLRKVDPDEITEAIEIFKAMNFDNRFQLTIN